MDRGYASKSGAQPKGPEIRFLVESALRIVSHNKAKNQPQTRQEWVEHLTRALMSESDAPHQAIVATMISRGITSEDILQTYVPASAHLLGEMWVNDRASFVDVTVGGARLQQLFRGSAGRTPGSWPARSIPLGESMFMIIPKFEDHSLGAFVAADNLRRLGIWVHMGIGLDPKELVEAIRNSHFSSIGISLSTEESVLKSGELIKYLRNNLDHVPPIVIGGRAVEIVDGIGELTGADFVSRSAEEAIEKCVAAGVPHSPGSQNSADHFE